MQFEVYKNKKSLGIIESNASFALPYWKNKGKEYELKARDSEARLYLSQYNFLQTITGKKGLGL